MNDNVDVSFLHKEIDKLREQTKAALKSEGGGGTFDDMNTTDINDRLHRIEGGWHIFQWACAVVTAVMIGGMGLLLAVQLSTQSEVKALASQVEALPNKINTNLMELNRTLSQAITASKDQPPQVILVPAPQVLPPAQTTPNQ